MPLHVWLPLAHPRPPRSGLCGALGSDRKGRARRHGRFCLPEDASGQVVTGLGLAGAFGAAIWGLTQANPKAVLAYSTVSQMGR